MIIVNGAVADHPDTGRYRYVVSSANNSILGTYKVVWGYTVQSLPLVKTQYYDVVVVYTSPEAVREEFPDIVGIAAATNDEIRRKEKLSRFIINSFCGQSFDFEENGVKTIRAPEDSNFLKLPKRIYSLTSLVKQTDDLTGQIVIDSDFYLVSVGLGLDANIKADILQPSQFFSKDARYVVTGNWGWEYVPEEIQTASNILIRDYFTDDRMLREHGVVQAQMGDRAFTFKDDLNGTTGNYDVDVLLSNYVLTSWTLI